MIRTTRPDEDLPASLPLRVLFAACVGNALEFYSVTVYAFVATTLSNLFFPQKPSVSLLLTFGMFGVSYLARPIGGFILGAYTDHKGRKASLLLSLQITLVGTIIMAFIPTYATVGLWAPLLMLLARVLQGFAVGGELGSATAYLLEQAPRNRRPLFASLQLASTGLGGIFAATAGLFFYALSAESRVTWGWRMIFSVPLILAPIGIYIRRHLDESFEFIEIGPARVSTGRLLFQHRGGILLAAGSIAALTANVYFRVYLPAFAIDHLGLPTWSPFVLMYITSIINIFLVPWVASLSTPVNGRRIMMASLALLTLVAWPSMILITKHATVLSFLFGCSLLSLLSAIYSAPQCFLIATLFPTQVRGAGISASYNLGVLAFGGFAPAIFSWLVSITHDNRTPALYIIAACIVSFVSLLLLPKTEQSSETSFFFRRLHPKIGPLQDGSIHMAAARNSDC